MPRQSFSINPKLLIPMMILMGILVMSMRIGDVWDTIENGKIFSRSAQAEESAKKAASAKAESTEKEAKMTPAPTEAAEKADKMAKSEMAADEARKSTNPPEDVESSAAEVELLKQLAVRRQELEKRDRDLDQREALIKVAELRVDQKIKEMESLRLQLQSLVGQANEAQTAQLDNLVKIYETMKPDEAARIFETLDMPILLGVIQKMKPKIMSPIMAKMAPEKAKEITVALTKQDQLPQLK
jgi:flagellar motility protein MotE (MotC chaperone)